jgi:CRP-like cAMP-binding protein
MKSPPAKRLPKLQTFPWKASNGATMTEYLGGQVVFAQGDPADAVFYVKKGKVKLTVLSAQGKEAVVAILGTGEFFGEGCLAGQLVRMSTAAGLTECTVARLRKADAVRMLQKDPEFSELFLAHLLLRNIRIEEDLVDQFFNSSEKRLARVLLLLANFGKEGRPEKVVPKIRPGNTGCDRRHHAFPHQLLYEPVSQTRLYRL